MRKEILTRDRYPVLPNIAQGECVSTVALRECAYVYGRVADNCHRVIEEK